MFQTVPVSEWQLYNLYYLYKIIQENTDKTASNFHAATVAFVVTKQFYDR